MRAWEVMGDLAALFGELWAAYLAKDALDRLALGIGIVFPIAGTAGTLTWVAVRRLMRYERGALERRLNAVEDQLAVRSMERDAAREEARLRTVELAEVSPAAWLATAEQERADGNELRAIETLRTGVERVSPNFRTAIMELAWDQLARGDENNAHHFAEAWRLSRIARALADGDDIAELRDGLREIDAGIAERSGRYDHMDPKWDVFEQARALEDAEVAVATVQALIHRIDGAEVEAGTGRSSGWPCGRKAWPVAPRARTLPRR